MWICINNTAFLSPLPTHCTTSKTYTSLTYNSCVCSQAITLTAEWAMASLSPRLSSPSRSRLTDTRSLLHTIPYNVTIHISWRGGFLLVCVRLTCEGIWWRCARWHHRGSIISGDTSTMTGRIFSPDSSTEILGWVFTKMPTLCMYLSIN